MGLSTTTPELEVEGEGDAVVPMVEVGVVPPITWMSTTSQSSNGQAVSFHNDLFPAIVDQPVTLRRTSGDPSPSRSRQLDPSWKRYTARR